jgi:4-hydroxythreonine-4-phosphate dehydrogenase
VGVVAASQSKDVVLIGEPSLWRRAAKLRGLDFDRLEVRPCEPGADPRYDHLPEIAAVATAVRGCQEGRFSAVMTGPIHKESLQARGFAFSGHTPYLADLCGLEPDAAVMFFAGGSLKVALATVHMPLVEVPRSLTVEAIARATRATAKMLQERFGMPNPRIALCGLNPHAGENGRLGTEDADVIEPAAASLRSEGLDVLGPFPADTLFARAARGDWDLVVAMYHDQGLIPVKTLDFGASVNITAGLPIVRTSVDHGTARDIAWTGQADPSHAVAALSMAKRLAGLA